MKMKITQQETQTNAPNSALSPHASPTFISIPQHSQIYHHPALIPLFPGHQFAIVPSHIFNSEEHAKLIAQANSRNSGQATIYERPPSKATSQSISDDSEVAKTLTYIAASPSSADQPTLISAPGFTTTNIKDKETLTVEASKLVNNNLLLSEDDQLIDSNNDNNNNNNNVYILVDNNKKDLQYVAYPLSKINTPLPDGHSLMTSDSPPYGSPRQTPTDLIDVKRRAPSNRSEHFNYTSLRDVLGEAVSNVETER